ncbi:MAG: hypothetical protein E7290_06840 [Lachnospiraceae bacterium]|nr:hypothetical protein [Lachnospiraceae bacterium]
MREKLMRFMQGRYGVDELSRFLSIASLVLIVLELLTRRAIFGALVWAIFIYIYFRMFSKNYMKRQQENQKFLTARYKWKTKWYNFKKDMRQRKDYHIYKCPQCGQKIRIPRGKGKIAIRCPKCYIEFVKRS